MSLDQDATSLPSGEKATLQTAYKWPLCIWRATTVTGSRGLAILPLGAGATNLPYPSRLPMVLVFCVDRSIARDSLVNAGFIAGFGSGTVTLTVLQRADASVAEYS